MGLDTTHDAWHGAYSAFNRWRNAVAEAAGYRIITPPRYNEPGFDPAFAGIGPYVDIDWDAVADKNYKGEWDTVPGDDPLIYLIVHSDCDGVIHPEQGRHLALRLRELLPKLPENGDGHLARYGVRGSTERFILGLDAAVTAGEDLEFH